jgi:hypothetical protein
MNGNCWTIWVLLDTFRSALPFFSENHLTRIYLDCTQPNLYGRGSERRKSLHRKSKKEHQKSKTSLLDQNVESLTSTVIKIKNYLWRFHPMSLG